MSFCTVFSGLRRCGPLAALWLLGLAWPAAQAGLQMDALRMGQQVDAGVTRQAAALTASHVTLVEMPPWEAGKAELQEAGGARQIGVGRPLASLQTPEQTRSLLAWHRLPNGGRAAALQWAPGGAFGLRLGVVFSALPEEAVFRVYASVQAAASYEVTGAALRERLQPDPATGARTWWTPDLGPTPVLEILLPASVADAELALAIPRVSQVVVPPSAVVPEMELAKRLSNGCQQDVNCQAALLDQRDAVIRMVYVSEANTFQCTGTLINNPKQDQTPYVLTAAHCARDQARASTLQSMWFYYSQSCNSEGLPASHTERYGGARWLATSFANDMTLLQLNDAPPPGALFAGWDASAVPMGAAAAGLHHPHGDLLMITKGRMQDQASCYIDYTSPRPPLSCAPEAAVDGGFYRLTVDSGGIEGGSSGSALFVDGRVVGTLTGGDSWCPAKGVVYGRLDQAVASTFLPWLGALVELDSNAAAPVYRFHIPKSGADFYTISAQERDAVIALLPDALRYTGVAFYASDQQRPRMLAVYRYFNPEVVAHFYTTSEAERQFVQQYHPSWHDEGIVWWVPAQGGDGAVPVYRSYQYSTGAHHYAADPAERDAWLGNPDLLYDGLAYYVWAAP